MPDPADRTLDRTPIRALLFGSIGSIVETSELQRAAFNEAFAAAGLDWHWDRETYRALLAASGGRDRVAAEAGRRGETVDVAAIHADKTRRFQALMGTRGLDPRPGVTESLALARERGLATGLVSTTGRESLDVAIAASGLGADAFDVVTSAEDVRATKPDPAAYVVTLERLGIAPREAVAVEDNGPGLASAREAGTVTIAFPGANTPEGVMDGADVQAGEDVLPAVRHLLTARHGAGVEA